MIAKQLNSGCGVCGQKEGLLQCSSCKVLSYCGRDHQIADRPAHKPACTAIRKAREKMEVEEQIIREHPGDFTLPPDPFTNAVGEFWGFAGTRDYMRARISLTKAMTEVDNTQSVQAQLDHLMDMLRLCHSENLGVRDVVPGLMLRLNKDQECYDFIKGWKVIVDSSRYEWGNTYVPYLDFKNADIFEPPDRLCRGLDDLSHLTCLCLLKIKLLLDIMRLKQSTSSLGPAFPREILDIIESSVPQSPAVQTSYDIMSGDGDVRETILDKLEVQIDQIFHLVEKTNDHFWHTLIDDGYQPTDVLEYYPCRSMKEVAPVMLYNYKAWAETPGAIDFIKRKINSVD